MELLAVKRTRGNVGVDGNAQSVSASGASDARVREQSLFARHLAAVKVREEHSEWLARRDAERYGPHGTYGT